MRYTKLAIKKYAYTKNENRRAQKSASHRSHPAPHATSASAISDHCPTQVENRPPIVQGARALPIQQLVLGAARSLAASCRSLLPAVLSHIDLQVGAKRTCAGNIPKPFSWFQGTMQQCVHSHPPMPRPRASATPTTLLKKNELPEANTRAEMQSGA